jgi:hypothetical protein
MHLAEDQLASGTLDRHRYAYQQFESAFGGGVRLIEVRVGR